MSWFDEEIEKLRRDPVRWANHDEITRELLREQAKTPERHEATYDPLVMGCPRVLA